MNKKKIDELYETARKHGAPGGQDLWGRRLHVLLLSIRQEAHRRRRAGPYGRSGSGLQFRLSWGTDVGSAMSSPSPVSAKQMIRHSIQESIEVKTELLEQYIPIIARLAELLIDTFRTGGKAILFGNDGSAADAQHVAGELINRFLMDRDALTADTSILTSIGNDVTSNQVFSRQVQALVQKGDVAVGISTSGNSPNVLNGITVAREKGAMTVGFPGRDGGRLKELADLCFQVPSDSTPRIQEAHITVWHAICEVVEQELFG